MRAAQEETGTDDGGPQHRAADSIPRPSGPRLLLVEDDPTIAEPLIEGLEYEGFRVRWVRTGQARPGRTGGRPGPARPRTARRRRA